MQLAARVQKDIDDKKNKTKKNTQRFKNAANNIMAFTGLKKDKLPPEIIPVRVEKGTLLTNNKKRDKRVTLKNKKSPEYLQNQII